MDHSDEILIQLRQNIGELPPWLRLALLEHGQKERQGPADNPRILQYFESTRYHAQHDEVPWCAAFVCHCLEHAGVASTRSARAASFADWGQGCAPRLGAIVVLGKSDPDAGGSGHVAFWVGEDDQGYCYLLGGNQSNAVNIARRRASRIVACRWPEVV